MSNKRRRKRIERGRFLETHLAAGGGLEVQLAADGDATGVIVDRDNGVIRNVSVLTAGMAYPAGGEPFRIDDVMLKQCADAINSNPRGIKSRISHPELAGGPHWVNGDSIFYLVGHCKTARIDGSRVRADMHLSQYAANSPHGNMREYLLGIAQEDPSACGVSIRFLMADSGEAAEGIPVGRIAAVMAVDFVGVPGGNPNGLLSGEDTNHVQPTPKTPGEGTPGELEGEFTMWKKLNSKQRSYLLSCGLTSASTDAQIGTCLSGMSAEQKAYYETLAGDEAGVPTPTPSATPVSAPSAPVSQNLAGDESKRVRAEALSEDRQRRKDILALASADSGITVEVAQSWADDNVSLPEATRLAELAKKLRPVATSRIEGGQDRNLATIADGISDALLLRAGVQLMTFDRVTGLAARDDDGRIISRKPHERAETMRRMPVPEMARAYLSAIGVDSTRMQSLSGEDCVGVASCARRDFAKKLQDVGGNVSLAMSTSDFPYILADALGKSFLGGYNLAPSTHQLWTSRRTAADFKTQKLINVSEAAGLSARNEGAGITYGTLSESQETVALVEYVSGLVFTRRMQINDDMGIFRDGGAMKLGAMARYKEDDVAYAILTANAAMSDGGLLFNITAVTTPGGHANLSSGSSTAIYAVCAPGLHPTVVMLFLESEQSPVLKQEVQWDTDDLKVAVRHSVAAKAADWRGLYKDVTGNVTVASLGLIVEAMATQKAPKGAFINLRPSYILTPVGTKEVAFGQLVGSSVDPSKNNATPNPFFNRLTVIGEPRLNS
jgi:hypothetical protein